MKSIVTIFRPLWLNRLVVLLISGHFIRTQYNNDLGKAKAVDILVALRKGQKTVLEGFEYALSLDADIQLLLDTRSSSIPVKANGILGDPRRGG